MSERPLSAVVLAAGEGTRMRSSRPKALHMLCGRPLVLHVIDALSELDLDRVVVVVGHGAERVTKTLQEQAPAGLVVDFVEQRVQRGTGDAVSVALTVLHDAGYGVQSLVMDDAMEAAGVNDRAQLAVAEAELRDRTNERWMRRGVTMLDPERTYIDTTVQLEADISLYPGTILQGGT